MLFDFVAESERLIEESLRLAIGFDGAIALVDVEAGCLAVVFGHGLDLLHVEFGVVFANASRVAHMAEFAKLFLYELAIGLVQIWH